MLRFISFTSGSCGNCSYLGVEMPDGTRKALMIDAGASMRRVKRILADNKLSVEDICGVLVTHEHLDHIRFLGTFCKYLRAKVYTSRKIHGALAAHSFTKAHIASCREVLPEEGWTNIGGVFEVKYFVVPHDAAQTVGYAVRCEGHLFVLMTDLEHVTPEAMELASQADTVIIESNYDYDMLINGPYSPELKKRILDEGHLCNADTAAAIKQFYHEGLRNLFLCHLSGNNNTPKLAYDSALAALREIGVEKGTIHLRTLDREVPSPVINL